MKAKDSKLESLKEWNHLPVPHSTMSEELDPALMAVITKSSDQDSRSVVSYVFHRVVQWDDADKEGTV